MKINYNNIKICQISKFYFPKVGGQQIYVDNLNNLFKKNNFSTYILQQHYGKTIPPVDTKYSKTLPFLYRITKNIFNYEWFIFNFEILLYEKKFLKTFDILISHYSFHYPVLFFFKKKIIILSHGVLWDKNKTTLFDKFLYYFDKKILRKKLTIVANDTNFFSAIGLNIDATHLLPFTEVKKNIWYVPNCINTEKFSPDYLIKKENIILIPRNLREDRGIKLGIESFSKFIKNNDFDFVLKIAGGPLNGIYYEECVELVKNLGITSKVEFLGFIDELNLISLYRRSKITLVPSLEKEGTSLTALESMACGTPVVSTNIGGLVDLPCLHAEVNAVDISKKMNYLLNNWSEIQEYQYSNVILNFNLERWSSTWLNIVNTK